jgi:hypothetical protein
MAPPRPRRTATVAPGVALESELERLRDRLRGDGVVKLSGKKLEALYGALAPRLRAEGFEGAGKSVLAWARRAPGVEA